MSYIILNGEIVSGDNPRLNVDNRAFNYGDGLFESMLLYKKKAIHFEQHLERLHFGMDALKMRSNPYLQLERFQNLFLELVEANEMETAKVRLSVYRNSKGYYKPESDDSSMLVQMKSLDSEPYTINEQGLTSGICTLYRKSFDPWANFKTSNALGFVMASIEARDSGVDELFILNTAGRLCESLSANIFLVKGNKVFTPSLSEACLAGTMRERVAKIVHDLNMEIESRPLEARELYDCDEVFLTNAIGGVRWIGSYEDRRYYNSVAKRVSEELKKSIQ